MYEEIFSIASKFLIFWWERNLFIKHVSDLIENFRDVCKNDSLKLLRFLKEKPKILLTQKQLRKT